MKDTVELLQRLQAEQFFGAITLKFESGTIVHIKLERNIKPSDLSGTPGTQHANRH
jgi:hypothetical protein